MRKINDIIPQGVADSRIMAEMLVYVSPCREPRALTILCRMYKRRVTSMLVIRILRHMEIEK